MTFDDNDGDSNDGIDDSDDDDGYKEYDDLHLWDNFLLHEVDAHGYEPHTQQDVDSPQHQLRICLLLIHVLHEFGLGNFLVFGLEGLLSLTSA